MVESCTARRVPSAKIDGSFAAAPEENFRSCLFGRVAKVVWEKPDAIIASIAGVSDRAARDYLSGKVPVPAVVASRLLHDILTRR